MGRLCYCTTMGGEAAVLLYLKNILKDFQC